MDDKFKTFLAQYNNKYWDFDGYYGPQCVDLVQFWSKYIGGPRFWGNAVDIYVQAGSFYNQIPNTITAIPKAGDIIVWSGYYNGGPGHTGIATGVANINTFQALEQNDPIGSNSHLRTYNYSYILGWLRAKTIPVTDPLTKIKSIINTSITDTQFRSQCRTILGV